VAPMEASILTAFEGSTAAPLEGSNRTAPEGSNWTAAEAHGNSTCGPDWLTVCKHACLTAIHRLPPALQGGRGAGQRSGGRSGDGEAVVPPLRHQDLHLGAGRLTPPPLAVSHRRRAARCCVTLGAAAAAESPGGARQLPLRRRHIGSRGGAPGVGPVGDGPPAVHGEGASCIGSVMIWLRSS
jgi:hypothetical protein